MKRKKYEKADLICHKITQYGEMQIRDLTNMDNSYKHLQNYYSHHKELKQAKALVLKAQQITHEKAIESSLELAKPVHQVHLKGLWIDKTEVTNEAFAKFVKSTGYKTVAERKPESRSISPIPPEKLIPSALVFTPPPQSVSKKDHWEWWRSVPGADWQHPECPGSNLSGRMNHPVVQAGCGCL